MDSERITLSSTKFPIGYEPNHRAKGITTYTQFKYVHELEKILSESLFQRLRNTFLGPVINSALRTDGGAQKVKGLGFSGQIVHFLLSRQIDTGRRNELWFHMGGQPMRFSLREFYLTTGLPCTKAESVVGEESDFDWPLISQKEKHTLEELLSQIKSLPEEEMAEEGKFRLSMLLIIESVFLMNDRWNNAMFPLEYVTLAKRDIQTYAWGKLAFDVLINSLKSVEDKRFLLPNQKYTLKGFPMALHLWFLASIPNKERLLAVVGNSESVYLCERYSKTVLPEFRTVVDIERSGCVEVVCVIQRNKVLPALVDEYSTGSLKSLIELVGRGYRLTSSDWLSKSIDLVKANEVIAQQNLRFRSLGPTEERNDALILNLLEEVKILKAKVEEVEILKARVLTLENQVT